MRTYHSRFIRSRLVVSGIKLRKQEMKRCSNLSISFYFKTKYKPFQHRRLILQMLV